MHPFGPKSAARMHLLSALQYEFSHFPSCSCIPKKPRRESDLGANSSPQGSTCPVLQRLGEVQRQHRRLQQEFKSCRERSGTAQGGGSLSIVFLILLALLVPSLD